MTRAPFNRVRRACSVAALLCVAQHSQAQETPSPNEAKAPACLAGEYVHSQMELVAGIRLNADGTSSMASLSDRSTNVLEDAGRRRAIASS